MVLLEMALALEHHVTEKRIINSEVHPFFSHMIFDSLSVKAWLLDSIALLLLQSFDSLDSYLSCLINLLLQTVSECYSHVHP